ncbi:MAG: hypothetical protein KGZ25_04170 [Planctomycetes bacterium]|nr:hypothetical protein [Planctomycetota bacterium]
MPERRNERTGHAAKRQRSKYEDPTKEQEKIYHQSYSYTNLSGEQVATLSTEESEETYSRDFKGDKVYVKAICFKGLSNCVVVWKIAGTDRHHGRQHIGTGHQHYDKHIPRDQVSRGNGTAGAAFVQISFMIP